MRPFEIYLVIGCVAAIIWPALFGVRPRRGIVAAGLVVLVVLQLYMEGYRWPVLPLYLVAIGLAVGDFVTLERSLPWSRRAGRALFGMIGMALTVGPAILFPVPTLPVPSGPLSIGTETIELAHSEVREEYGRSPGVRRRVTAQIWYPAHPDEDAQPEPWSRDVGIVAPALAERMGVPGFLFNSARHTASHSYGEAPPDEGGFPVVVFSHDWEGFRQIALGQIENLVSHGYVVIGIDHTYGAVATVIEGEPRYLDPDALGEEDDDDVALREAEEALIGTFAADITLVLDEVAEGDEGAFGSVNEAIDAEQVALWGQGIGGGAALQVCLTDERCDAFVGQDARVEALPDQVLATTATRPMLLLRSDQERQTSNDAVLRGVVARSETINYWVGVLGADSSDFGAAPFVSPIASELGMRGPIDADRVLVINRRLVTGFLDRFLLDTGPAALDTLDFPEVDLEVVDRR